MIRLFLFLSNEACCLVLKVIFCLSLIERSLALFLLNHWLIDLSLFPSKASFFDRDDIPSFTNGNEKEYVFSGKRIKRGLYKTSTGSLINADVNGALNILKKSNVVDLTVLYSRGEVDTPLRIRVV